jgi:hypothetical protein
MDKSFILQQLAYHTMICNALRQELDESNQIATQAIKESRQAVQTISFDQMATAVKKYAVENSKENARSILLKIAGVSVIREVKPEFYNKIYEAVTNG